MNLESIAKESLSTDSMWKKGATDDRKKPTVLRSPGKLPSWKIGGKIELVRWKTEFYTGSVGSGLQWSYQVMNLGSFACRLCVLQLSCGPFLNAYMWLWLSPPKAVLWSSSGDSSPFIYMTWAKKDFQGFLLLKHFSLKSSFSLTWKHMGFKNKSEA